jgi:hypothetical protein
MEVNFACFPCPTHTPALLSSTIPVSQHPLAGALSGSGGGMSGAESLDERRQRGRNDGARSNSNKKPSSHSHSKSRKSDRHRHKQPPSKSPSVLGVTGLLSSLLAPVLGSAANSRGGSRSTSKGGRRHRRRRGDESDDSATESGGGTGSEGTEVTQSGSENGSESRSGSESGHHRRRGSALSPTGSTAFLSTTYQGGSARPQGSQIIARGGGSSKKRGGGLHGSSMSGGGARTPANGSFSNGPHGGALRGRPGSMHADPVSVTWSLCEQRVRPGVGVGVGVGVCTACAPLYITCTPLHHINPIPQHSRPHYSFSWGVM